MTTAQTRQEEDIELIEAQAEICRRRFEATMERSTAAHDSSGLAKLADMLALGPKFPLSTDIKTIGRTLTLGINEVHGRFYTLLKDAGCLPETEHERKLLFHMILEWGTWDMLRRVNPVYVRQDAFGHGTRKLNAYEVLDAGQALGLGKCSLEFPVLHALDGPLAAAICANDPLRIEDTTYLYEIRGKRPEGEMSKIQWGLYPLAVDEDRRFADEQIWIFSQDAD